MKYQLITTNKQLSDLCQQIGEFSEIAIDTEFTRRKTFYPILGLIQLQINSKPSLLIDPINITDWQPFKNILHHPTIIKILHACSEDFDIFKYYFEFPPSNYLDTQIIASFVGHPLSTGLATLVKYYLNIELDKSECRTDWLKRPLTTTQCEYAASDVIYLKQLTDILLERLDKTPWEAAVKQELQHCYHKKIAEPSEEKAYLNIKHAWQLTSPALARLKILATWRIREAKQQNMALNFVVSEEELFKLAKYAPQSYAQLAEFGIHSMTIRRYGKNLLDCLQQALEMLPTDYPKPIIRAIDLPNYKKNFNRVNQIIQDIAQKVQLPKELLASRKQIDQLLFWQAGIDNKNKQPEIITGWRGELLASSLITQS